MHSRLYFLKKWCHFLYCWVYSSQTLLSTSSSASNFATCPEWLENSQRTGINILHLAVVMHVSGKSKTDSNSIKKSNRAWAFSTLHIKRNMSGHCTEFCSIEDPVRVRNVHFLDVFHNSESINKIPSLCNSEVQHQNNNKTWNSG